MVKRVIIVVISTALLSCGGFFIFIYGKSKYEEGKLAGIELVDKANETVANRNKIILKEIQNEVLTEPEVINDLYDLGIMRPHTDR